MESETLRLIDFSKVTDPRGNLTFIESGEHVPFRFRRNYWIYDVPGGKWRDGHAFRTADEVIVPLSGSFDVITNDGINPSVTHHLVRPDQGLFVPRLTWRSIEHFSTNAVALVLSSTLYDPEDYIEDFQEFTEVIRRQPKTPKAVEETPEETNDPKHNRHSTIDDCAIYELSRHHHDNGNLTVVQNNDELPVNIQRTFYIYDVPGGAERGGHSHRACYEFIVAVSGAFDVTVTDGKRERTFTLNRPYQGLLVVPGIWRTLQNFSSGSVCLALASQHFDEQDYIRDYDEFLHEKQK